MIYDIYQSIHSTFATWATCGPLTITNNKVGVLVCSVQCRTTQTQPDNMEHRQAGFRASWRTPVAIQLAILPPFS